MFWHPRGAITRHIIETFWKDLHLQRGYDLVYSPHIAKVDLWKTSGHFDFYKENMYDQMQVNWDKKGGEQQSTFSSSNVARQLYGLVIVSAGCVPVTIAVQDRPD